MRKIDLIGGIGVYKEDSTIYLSLQNDGRFQYQADTNDLGALFESNQLLLPLPAFLVEGTDILMYGSGAGNTVRYASNFGTVTVVEPNASLRTIASKWFALSVKDAIPLKTFNLACIDIDYSESMLFAFTEKFYADLNVTNNVGAISINLSAVPPSKTFDILSNIKAVFPFLYICADDECGIIAYGFINKPKAFKLPRLLLYKHGLTDNLLDNFERCFNE